MKWLPTNAPSTVASKKRLALKFTTSGGRSSWLPLETATGSPSSNFKFKKSSIISAGPSLLSFIHSTMSGLLVTTKLIRTLKSGELLSTSWKNILWGILNSSERILCLIRGSRCPKCRLRKMCGLAAWSRAQPDTRGRGREEVWIAKWFERSPEAATAVLSF